MIARVTNFAVAFLMATSTASVFELRESTDTINNNNPKQPLSPSVKRNDETVSKQVLLRKHENVDENQQKQKEQQQKEVANVFNYRIIFDKCQYVEKISTLEILARNEEEGEKRDGVTEQSVTFRLCYPGDSNSCDNKYEERTAYLDEYLQIIVEYRRDEQDHYCELCNEICVEGDAHSSRYLRGNFSQKVDVDCDKCTDECENIENMEENGYIDATNFITCQQIVRDDKYPLYAGPICSGGLKFNIGVFEDEDCMSLVKSKSVDAYITDENGHAFKLSHALLKQTYDDTAPITCKQIKKENNGVSYRHEYNAATETKEVCTNLYQAATRYEQAQMN